MKGRVAIITGGARGIGDAIARRFGEAGARIFALDRIAPPEPRAGVRYIEADVCNAKSVDEAFATVEREAGAPDVLVSNAGIQRVGLIGTLSFEDWSEVIGTHLNGLFLCASQAIPRMTAAGKGGAIIAMASTAAMVGMPGRGPYCAAKAGILGLVRAMALETASARIRVNAVAPGYTRTKLVDDAIANGSLREEWMMERVPLGRLATPDEIAGAVAYLASDEAAYVTGQTLVIDGGWTVQGQSNAPGWLRGAGPAPTR